MTWRWSLSWLRSWARFSSRLKAVCYGNTLRSCWAIRLLWPLGPLVRPSLGPTPTRSDVASCCFYHRRRGRYVGAFRLAAHLRAGRYSLLRSLLCAALIHGHLLWRRVCRGAHLRHRICSAKEARRHRGIHSVRLPAGLCAGVAGLCRHLLHLRQGDSESLWLAHRFYDRCASRSRGLVDSEQSPGVARVRKDQGGGKNHQGAFLIVVHAATVVGLPAGLLLYGRPVPDRLFGLRLSAQDSHARRRVGRERRRRPRSCPATRPLLRPSTRGRDCSTCTARVRRR